MRTSFHHQHEAQHPKSPAIYTPAGRLPHLWVKDGLAIQHQRRPLSVVATGDKMVRRGERSHVPIATNALQQTASLFNHFIGASEQLRVSIASPLMQPSPNGRRVGIRIVTFEACSGFTHVTACRIAQPPKAAFVTRLQPCRLPDRAARQLPDQSTTLWVESSSTSDPRLRGALPIADINDDGPALSSHTDPQ